MLRLFQEKDEIRVVDDQIGAPTSARFLAEKTAEILNQLKTKEEGEDRWGLYHLSEDKTMSWYGFARKIFEIQDNKNTFKTIKIIPIISAGYKPLARRPLNSILNSRRIKGTF